MTVKVRLLAVVLAAVTLAMPMASVASAAPPQKVDVIVVLDDTFAGGDRAQNQARARDVAREHGLTATHAYGSALFGFSASVPQGRLSGLERDPRVEYVNPDRPVQASASQSTPWGVQRVGAPLESNRGTGVDVYVLDTGIDANHRDLKGNLGTGHAVETCKGRCSAPWDDDAGHGTHVAGTIAAADNNVDVVGVAPEATLHAVKVLNKQGSGSWSAVIAGVDWVESQIGTEPVVVNMSLGGGVSMTGSCSSDGFFGTDSLHEAICNATIAGAVFAVAAGNDGDDAANHVPAAYDDAVITISASDTNDAWPSWSNYGEVVDLAAPGVGITSTVMGGGTGVKSGTSMATPHVAGGAALYLAANSGTPTGYKAFQDVLDGLTTTTTELGDATNHSEDLLNVAAFGSTGSTGPQITDLSVSAPAFSPNGDGVLEQTEISFSLNDAADWTVEVGGVCTATGNGTTSVTLTWDGTRGNSNSCTGGSTVVTDSDYTVTVSAGSDAQSTTITVDTKDPIVSSPSAEVVSATSATVSWDLSEPASVMITYGPTGSSTTTVGPISDTSVILTDLSPETDYSYTVVPTDAAGNEGASAGGSFSTPAAATADVTSIEYAGTGGRNRDLHVDVSITVEDSSGVAVSGAQVTAIMSDDGVNSATFTGTTSGGVVTFRWNHLPDGCYTTVIDELVVDGQAVSSPTTPDNTYAQGNSC